MQLEWEVWGQKIAFNRVTAEKWLKHSPVIKPVTHGDKNYGRVYGFPYMGRIYVTERKENHILRKHNSFGIDTDILQQVSLLNTQCVLVIYTDPTGAKRYFLSELASWRPDSILSITWVDPQSSIQQQHVRLADMIELH